MKARQQVFLCLLIILPALGCSLFTGRPTSPAQTAVSTVESPTATAGSLPATASPAAPAATSTTAAQTQVAPLTLEILKNFTYNLEYSPDGKIPLKDGSYENSTTNPPSRITSNLLPQMAFGDLNADGVADAAVALATNTGGSGTFINIIAVLNTPGGPSQAASAYLDDRAPINAITIENGQIKVDFRGHGPNDPLCCPTVHLLRVYNLQGAALTLISESNLP